MKNWYIYLLCILVSSNFFACQDDDLEDQSIFDASEKEKSEFDRWLLENYVNPYNIDFKYRMEHIESDYTHNLVPTDFWLSVKLAKIVKHCWLEAYDEVGGLDFTRACAPKVIHLISFASETAVARYHAYRRAVETLKRVYHLKRAVNVTFVAVKIGKRGGGLDRLNIVVYVS